MFSGRTLCCRTGGTRYCMSQIFFNILRSGTATRMGSSARSAAFCVMLVQGSARLFTVCRWSTLSLAEGLEFQTWRFDQNAFFSPRLTSLQFFFKAMNFSHLTRNELRTLPSLGKAMQLPRFSSPSRTVMWRSVRGYVSRTVGRINRAITKAYQIHSLSL